MATDWPNITFATGETMTGAGRSVTPSNYTVGKFGWQYRAITKEYCRYSGQQAIKIGSQHMNDEAWLKLAPTINQPCRSTGGFVIAHGPNTLEETARYGDKTVVMVGVMRLSTAMSADGSFTPAMRSWWPQTRRSKYMRLAGNVLYGRNLTQTNLSILIPLKSVNFGP